MTTAAHRWHVEPIGMDDAARALGVCRRLLSDILARHPHYETRGRTGRKKVFYPEHIDRIREALQCEKTGNPNSTPNTDGRSNSRSKAGEFAAARQLADLYSDCGARDDDLVAATIRALADEVEWLRAIMAVADQTIWAMDALQEQPHD